MVLPATPRAFPPCALQKTHLQKYTLANRVSCVLLFFGNPTSPLKRLLQTQLMCPFGLVEIRIKNDQFLLLLVEKHHHHIPNDKHQKALEIIHAWYLSSGMEINTKIVNYCTLK